MEAKTLIEIEVNLLGFLRNYLPKESKGSTCKIQLPKQMSVTQALKELNIPDEISQKITIIMINGAHAKKDYILCHGDVLTVLPIAAGG